MKVVELWRYPVKSLQGEQLDQVEVGPDGLDGDRRFALYDRESGLGLTARRVPELLFASASLRQDGEVDITLPDGSVTRDDDVLSAWLDRPVTLRSAREDVARSFENVVDFEREPTSEWKTFSGAPGPFHDDADFRVSLVSRASLGSWDRRRFRSNVLLDGEGEDALVGRRAALGEAIVDVRGRIERCVMTTRAQPEGVERDLQVLRTIAQERDACLAVGGLVVRSGMVRVGDFLEDQEV